uniref:DUF19 domain-containing protein n=1 Tax=Panagrolaimus sp. JU765 TaxID=591449 RepID=A0AC34QJ12_9BILA
MSKINFVAVAFVLLSLPASSLKNDHCSKNEEKQIAKCMEPIDDFEELLDRKAETSMMFPIPTKEDFIEMCKLFGDYEICIKPYLDKCSKNEEAIYKNATYAYLCKKGQETYLENMECLRQVDLEMPNVKECKWTFVEELLEIVLNLEMSPSKKIDQTCLVTHTYFNCLCLPVKTNCELDASNLVEKVTKDMIGTFLPFCTFEEFEGKYVDETKKRAYYEEYSNTIKSFLKTMAETMETMELDEFLVFAEDSLFQTLRDYDWEDFYKILLEEMDEIFESLNIDNAHELFFKNIPALLRTPEMEDFYDELPDMIWAVIKTLEKEDFFERDLMSFSGFPRSVIEEEDYKQLPKKITVLLREFKSALVQK